MIQIGLIIMAIGLLFAGIKALAGKEAPGKQTSKPVAITLVVLGVAVIAFALIGLPLLIQQL